MNNKKLIRFWCHKCQDFTIQEVDGKCLTCETINESYKLSDVPMDKIETQRSRYKAAEMKSVFSPFLNFMNPDSFMSSVEFANRSTIIEDDAGQKAIDETNAKKREEWRKEQDAKRAEYLKFKGTNRNDSCPCGSNKKYKHCCLDKFSGI